MQRMLDIRVLKELYKQLDGNKYRQTKTLIINAFANHLKEQTGKNLREPNDALYYVLNGKKANPTLEEHKCLNEEITKHWKHHFGEDNLEAKVNEIKANLSSNSIAK